MIFKKIIVISVLVTELLLSTGMIVAGKAMCAIEPNGFLKKLTSEIVFMTEEENGAMQKSFADKGFLQKFNTLFWGYLGGIWEYRKIWGSGTLTYWLLKSWPTAVPLTEEQEKEERERRYQEDVRFWEEFRRQWQRQQWQNYGYDDGYEGQQPQQLPQLDPFQEGDALYGAEEDDDKEEKEREEKWQADVREADGESKYAGDRGYAIVVYRGEERKYMAESEEVEGERAIEELGLRGNWTRFKNELGAFQAMVRAAGSREAARRARRAEYRKLSLKYHPDKVRRLYPRNIKFGTEFLSVCVKALNHINEELVLQYG